MSVLKDKNGNYYVKYWKNGKSATKRGFGKGDKGKYYAKKYENAIRDKEADTAFIKFQDLIIEYREYYKKTVTHGTYARTGIFWDSYILPKMPNKSINKITPLECLEFWKYVDSLDKSTGYKNDIIGTLKGAFKYAKKYHQLKVDPTETLDRYKKTREEKLQKKNKDLLVWEIEEYKQFIKCVRDRMYKLLFDVLYLTGMRKGECLSLTWDDVFDHKISITKSLSRKAEDGAYEIKEPKTVSSIRDVSIDDILYNELLEYRKDEEKIPGFKSSWLIFGRTKPVAENTLTRVKDRACDESGVKRIKIHSIRHSHASYLISNGVPITAVSRRLGHTDVAMTLSIYTHLMEKNEDELNNELERISKDIHKDDESNDK